MPAAQSFKYESPSDFSRGRKIVTLCQTDRIYCSVSMIKEGGEIHLHSHKTLDGVWFVLSGRARFYGDNDTLIGEFGKHEGVLIPRHFRYWFESAGGDEPLELMQIEASDVPTVKGQFSAAKLANVIDELDGRTRTVVQSDPVESG